MLQKSLLSITGTLLFLSIITNTHAQDAENYAIRGYDVGIRSALSVQDQLFPYKIDSKLTKEGYAQGIQSSMHFRSPILKSHKIQFELSILRKAINSVEIDIKQYLNRQADRRTALLDHIDYLKKLQLELQNRDFKLQRELTELEAQSTRLSNSVSSNEQEFFGLLPQFQINPAIEAYENFVDDSKKNVELRAHIGAMQYIQSMYATLTPNLSKLIIAMEANKEALIQGITVVDVEDIDLGIIKRESEE